AAQAVAEEGVVAAERRGIGERETGDGPALGLEARPVEADGDLGEALAEGVRRKGGNLRRTHEAAPAPRVRRSRRPNRLRPPSQNLRSLRMRRSTGPLRVASVKRKGRPAMAAAVAR